MSIQHFNSVDDVLKIALQSSFYREPSEFLGDRSVPQAVKMVQYGGTDSHIVSEAKALVEKIDASIGVRFRGEYVPAVCGAYPVVGEYLMGQPLCMRRYMEVEAETAPVRIYVEALVSGSVGESALVKRGAAIVALVTAMQNVRPVELYVFGAASPNGRLSAYSARVHTPVSLETACAIFCTREYYRMINFHYFYADTNCPKSHCSTIHWGLGRSPGPGREKTIRESFNLNPQDIVLQGGYSTDEALMNRDPIAWVNKYLDGQREMPE